LVCLARRTKDKSGGNLRQKLSVKNVFFAIFAIALVIRRGIFEVAVFALSLGAHEAAHALAAHILGVKTALEPGMFGFTFKREGVPINIAGMYWLHLSGPIANLAIAIGVNAASKHMYIPLKEFVVFYNQLLFVLNMLPAYPLDFARALETTLSAKRGRLKAVGMVTKASFILSATIAAYGVWMATARFSLIPFGLAAFFAFSAFRELQNAKYETIEKIKSKLAA